ncbi:MAG: molybdopterin molybdotransferase MoeA [Deltaproteobacteria bacterium]|nr:molybdopterin molybdotransferase MoeA [Deltaproteobacteria bacterium]
MCGRKAEEMSRGEMDEGKDYLGYSEALHRILACTFLMSAEEVGLEGCLGRILAVDVKASVDSPGVDVSLKDGYALRSLDVAEACTAHPVRLRLTAPTFAGSSRAGAVEPGTAAKVFSGAPIPSGADAVVAEEFCQEESNQVVVRISAEPGRNILPRGEDIRAGALLFRKGQRLLPGHIGLLAAAGWDRLSVFVRPKVAIVSIGDEVVAPGRPLAPGQLYASNMVTLGAWLRNFDIPSFVQVVRDDTAAIRQALLHFYASADTILTSGGAWGSERDFIVRLLDGLGWNKVFHRVRIGPGKGIAFGLWEGKPVFCLPGGPPSNEIAFLQLALPGILRMAGYSGPPFATISARLIVDLEARSADWTQFVHARLSMDLKDGLQVTPHRPKSRLESIAAATCLITIPEGEVRLEAGQMIPVQLIAPLSQAMGNTCFASCE